MKHFLILTAFFLFTGVLYSQENYNLTVRGHLPFQGKTLANIGGYADSSGNEYALVGTSTGLAIVDVTDPDSPVLKFDVNGVQNFWREVKTWKGFAYVTTEGANGGLTIVDLRELPDTVTSRVYRGNGAIATQLKTIHALHIDDGFCYLYGSNLANGGIVILDLADPWNPVYAGKYDTRYVHDGFVARDTVWGCSVYQGFFTAIDVSNKANPVELAQQETPGNFTHNSWLTDDHKTLLTTDENENSFLTAYDITNVNNITELDRYQTAPGSNSIVHNAHVLNDFSVTSWYTEGVVIVDAARPQNLVEVAKNDFTTFEGGDFHGCWGVYPFLPSGNLVASDIENGLYVLTPTYIRACYLEGTVTDSACGALIEGVTVTIESSGISEQTSFAGDFRMGTPNAGIYSVTFSKAGYNSKIFTGVNLQNAVVTELDVLLTSDSAVYYAGSVSELGTSDPVADAQISISNQTNAYVISSDDQGEFGACGFIADSYQQVIGKWGFITQCESISLSTSTLPSEHILKRGYFDDFQFNFGWTVTSTASTGAWERALPSATTFENVTFNPDVDASGDCNGIAYVTGNTPNSEPGVNDVDDGYTRLTSPEMDLNAYSNPYIFYYRWFANGGGAGTPNDTLFIRLRNAGDAPVTVKKITRTDQTSQWVPEQIRVLDYLTSDAGSVKFVAEVWDYFLGHLVEAGIDRFEVIDSISPVSAVSSLAIENGFTVFPNPSNGEAFVKLTKSLKSGSMRILDTEGRELYRTTLAGNSTTEVLPGSLSSGIYLIQLIEDGSIAGTKKWIKLY